ncbi:pupal cuticle protein 36a-like [Ochlerotatus camptorhynchus]|uniref:pupal cuticle protein 36a-like n=1 Tax=Ochlerotatus camptorhynchus TaxID=644619 RepID=UPI0031DA9B00
MKILVVLACVAMAAARPEAPLHGYNYPAPRPIVQTAVASGGAHGGGYSHGGGHSHGGGYYQAPAPVVHSQSFGVSGSYQAAPVFQSTGFGSAVSGGGGHGGHSSGFGSIVSGGHGGHSSGFGSVVSGGASQVQSFAPQQTVVQKHIYVHVPPQDPEETRAQQIISQGVARKHYKIIFIKTPNVQSSAAQIALQQAQQEEKTIVYVLVKKPDDQGDINIPQLPALPPSKPEVYFIKYKANRGGSSGAGAIGGGIGGAIGGAIGGVSSGGGQSISHGHGFDASLGSGASSGASTHVSGSVPHTEYGAPTGHQGYA